ncbi:MAG: Stk1 family PASTA domain-containing Ser/Thr kinase [Nitriliruptoraceae bacterium]|nr:Stk1 family PASTA domain-containing Ser/Thr kinase [Nitriliruptoraceae bacterium]
MPDAAAGSTTEPVRVGDRYVLGPELGRGGMARVHRAHDEVLDRDVAVKLLHPHLAADATFLARFRREARAAAALAHPNVVGVHDWGETEDGAYLVMQLIDGVSLRDVLRRRGSLSPAESLAVLAPAAAGLGAAHAAGLVHRDVKPENLLIGRDGVVRVTDFGLARAAASATSTFGPDVLVGSPHYLAPEAVQGESLDARADVYALGIVLVECLTGAPPHDAESPFATAMQHTLHAVPPPSTLREGIDELLDDVVVTATAMDREARYDDASAFGAALTRMLGGAVPRVAPPGGSTPPPPPSTGTSPTGTSRMPRIDRDAATQLVAPTTSVVRRPAAPSTPGGAGDIVDDTGPPPPPGSEQDDPPEPTAPRRSRRGWLTALLVLLLLAGSGAGGYLFWDRVMAPVTPIPDVLGDPIDDADAALDAAGFTVRVDPDRPFDLGTPAGHVLAQTPEGELRQGGTVTLVLSNGPRPVDIPDLAGEDQAEAVEALTEAGLQPRVTERFDESVPAGTVLATVPGADTTVDEATEVELVVSAGPSPIDVIDVTGQPEAAAIDALEALGLRGEVVARPFSDRPAGEVIAQDPGPDATRFADDTVELTVSDGPEPVEVPGVRGERVDDAVAVLRGLGFDVEVERRGGFGALLNPDQVYDQDPAPGSRRPVGDTIILYAYN